VEPPPEVITDRFDARFVNTEFTDDEIKNAVLPFSLRSDETFTEATLFRAVKFSDDFIAAGAPTLKSLTLVKDGFNRFKGIKVTVNNSVEDFSIQFQPFDVDTAEVESSPDERVVIDNWITEVPTQLTVGSSRTTIDSIRVENLTQWTLDYLLEDTYP